MNTTWEKNTFVIIYVGKPAYSNYVESCLEVLLLPVTLKAMLDTESLFQLKVIRSTYKCWCYKFNYKYQAIIVIKRIIRIILSSSYSDISRIYLSSIHTNINGFKVNSIQLWLWTCSWVKSEFWTLFVKKSEFWTLFLIEFEVFAIFLGNVRQVDAA